MLENKYLVLTKISDLLPNDKTLCVNMSIRGYCNKGIQLNEPLLLYPTNNSTTPTHKLNKVISYKGRTLVTETEVYDVKEL